MIKLGKILFWFICLLALFVGIFGSSIIYGFSLCFVSGVFLIHYLIKFIQIIPSIFKRAKNRIKDTIKKYNPIIILLIILGVSATINVVLIITCIDNKWNYWSHACSLFINIAGAFIALYLIYILLRPRFEVCSTIARSLNNRICVKVKNKSIIAKLYSVKVELFYCGKNEQVNDEVLNKLPLDSDSQVTLLTHKFSSNPQYNRYYIFQSDKCFYKQWNQLKCRVSATNTISNIVDIQDEYIKYDTVQWGEYNGDSFYSVEQLYAYKERQRIRKLIVFNETISPVLRPRSKKITGTDNVYKTAISFLSTLTQEYNDFQHLKEVEPVIEDMKIHIAKLQNLLIQDLRPIHKERRNALLHKIDKELRCISTHMENSLERKSLTIKI